MEPTVARPIVTRFRNLYEQATIPLGYLCLRAGLTPDMLTLLSLSLGGLAAYVIAQSAFLSGILLILLMAFADMLDGATARAGGTANSYGTLFDHVSDRYAEFLILLGMMLSGVVAPGWAMFALTKKLRVDNSTPSAGTRSPAASLTVSPGTTCATGRLTSVPLRRTFAFNATCARSASTAL